MALVAGIDESGKGPILGPLVMCGVVVKEEHLATLKQLGVKDSKLVTPALREKLFVEILKVISDYFVLILEPQEIDDAINSPTLNLNWLEAQKAAEIINYLKPPKVIVDCPSPNISRYTQYLKHYVLNKDTEVICEHKADVNHVVVSAASIIAKEYREREVAKIKKIIGKDIGSGYLSDPVTQVFFKEYFEVYPQYFRKSWKPYQDLIKKKFQKNLSDF